MSTSQGSAQRLYVQHVGDCRMPALLLLSRQGALGEQKVVYRKVRPKAAIRVFTLVTGVDQFL